MLTLGKDLLSTLHLALSLSVDTRAPFSLVFSIRSSIAGASLSDMPLFLFKFFQFAKRLSVNPQIITTKRAVSVLVREELSIYLYRDINPPLALRKRFLRCVSCFNLIIYVYSVNRVLFVRVRASLLLKGFKRDARAVLALSISVVGRDRLIVDWLRWDR